MDHAPGPIIAAAPPNVARIIDIHGSPPSVIARDNSTPAINIPAIGLQRPTRSSSAAIAPMLCAIIAVERDAPMGSMIPQRTSSTTVRILCSRRPTPGQPSAKFEKVVAKSLLVKQESTEVATEPKRRSVGDGDPTFGGIQFDDASGQADRHGVGAVVRAQLRQYVCEVALHGRLTNREMPAYLLV